MINLRRMRRIATYGGGSKVFLGERGTIYKDRTELLNCTLLSSASLHSLHLNLGFKQQKISFEARSSLTGTGQPMSLSNNKSALVLFFVASIRGLTVFQKRRLTAPSFVQAIRNGQSHPT